MARALPLSPAGQDRGNSAKWWITRSSDSSANRFNMPNTASAKKRLRQNQVIRLRNRSIKSAVRTQMKKVRAAAETGDIEKAESEYILAAKKLDKAGAKRVFHPNTSARYKSRLQNAIKAAKAAK